MAAPAKSRKRVRYHHGNLPAALVEAATELLEDSGLDALTLRAVARKVGVTHAAPYRHFKDKSALLGAVAAAGFEALASAMARERRAMSSPESGLEAAGRAYSTFATSGAARFRLMFADSVPGALGTAAATVLGDIVQAVANLAAVGGPSSPTEHRHLALSLWAQWHGLAVLALAGALDGQDVDELLQHATRRLVHRTTTRFELTTLPAPSVSEAPPRRDEP